MIIGKIYKKAEEADIAECYMQFYKDLVRNKNLYTLGCLDSVKHSIKGLKSKQSQRKEISGADSLFEQILTDTLMKNYRMASTAEEIGFSNAMGYDICIPDLNAFIEAKAYTVTYIANRLSAMISNIRNKFCSVVALVIDPCIDGDKKYKIYIIPPEEIYSDTTDYIDIVHHRIVESSDNSGQLYMICEQLDKIGSNKNQFIINDISELHSHIESFKSINVKRMAAVLRSLDKLSRSETQIQSSDFIKKSWNSMIRTGNATRKKDKLPLDYNNEKYNIIDDGSTNRIFFKSGKFIFKE